MISGKLFDFATHPMSRYFSKNNAGETNPQQAKTLYMAFDRGGGSSASCRSQVDENNVIFDLLMTSSRRARDNVFI